MYFLFYVLFFWVIPRRLSLLRILYCSMRSTVAFYVEEVTKKVQDRLDSTRRKKIIKSLEKNWSGT